MEKPNANSLQSWWEKVGFYGYEYLTATVRAKIISSKTLKSMEKEFYLDSHHPTNLRCLKP